jgi:hypothetical protein
MSALTITANAYANIQNKVYMRCGLSKIVVKWRKKSLFSKKMSKSFGSSEIVTTFVLRNRRDVAQPG